MSPFSAAFLGPTHLKGLVPHGLWSPRLAGAVCAAVGVGSALPAAYDVWKVLTIAVDQLHGPAEGTDFLNLYAGARLLVTDPHSTYQLEVQRALQHSLTGWDSPLVPFYLPPYAALLVAWLGWLSYPIAYVVWLVIGVCFVALAIGWMAPSWTRASGLAWFGLAMLFLPCLLGLGQGQTSALMLACTAAFAQGMLDRRQASTRLALSVAGLALKPQFAPVFVCALVVGRRWRALTGAAILVAALSAVALVRLGPDGIAAYSLVSRQKLHETLSAEPAFLIGPTLLHASHWFLGVNNLAHGVAGVLVLATLLVFVAVWRRGPATDDALLLQLALLPVVSVIAAPYALVYELTSWIVSFWLLWRYTGTRPSARAGLLWLTAAVWVAGNVGVAQPLAGGADVAALLGLCLVAFIGWLYRSHCA